MRQPPAIDDVVLPEGRGIHTFSNGSEWDSWASGNCHRCRWFNAEIAGKDCAFECAAFIHKVSPDLALQFGWTQRTTEYGPLSGWRAPEECAFFRDVDDNSDGESSPPPFVDPSQFTFLVPDGFPEATATNDRIAMVEASV